MSGRLPRRNDERGVTLILVGLMMVALLTMAALVLDTGLARADRRANKAITDAAVVAAAEGLKSGPWPGVCEAYRYVLANARRFSAFDAETWTNAAAPGTATYAPSPCASAGPPFNVACNPGDQSTWGRFEGSAAGGDVIVIIQSGYVLPDPAVPEDASISGDTGVSPCDNVAVKIADRRAPNFSSIIGAGPLVTNTRSVARLDTGFLDVAALVVLEETDCGALTVKANSPSDVVGLEVSAVGNRPGIVQVDSDASTACSGSARAIEGSPLPSTQLPSIVAKASSAPVVAGRIGVPAVATNPGKAYSLPTCSSPTTSPCAISPTPVARNSLGRSMLNQRYVGDSTRGLTKLRAGALDLLDDDDGPPVPANPYLGYVTYTSLGGSCNTNAAGVIVTDPKVYIDCADLRLTSGGSLTFNAPNVEIITRGTITVNSGATLTFVDPRKILIEGDDTGGNPVGVSVAGSMNINAGSSASCAARHTFDKNKVAKVLVRYGAFDVSDSLMMCQTTLFMLDGNLPSPAGNSAKGSINVGAQGGVDWSAPNVKDTGPAVQADWDAQEDLALWTEAAGGSGLSGGSNLRLEGVFALANAETFTVTGNGAGDISANAQFWTHKLSITGKGIVRMQPNPNDSVPTFDKALVR